MKLNQFNRNVMTSGGETTQFTATMNGAAFAILSDGIYEHKPAAIVRETCCNAYDSHIEAGREEVPFKVQLPNQFSPNLIIEDTGIGLDDDGVRKVFASYFNSTKNATDDVTGGFGIGAKSLFSYTDAFEIVAKKDGVRRDYTAFIGDDGIPNVQLVDESETTDHNGVSIRMPVRASDFKKFENEARVVCSFFKIKPEVTGVKDFEFEVDDVYQQIEDNGFASMGEYTSSSLYNDRFYALMNNVIYPIPRTVVHRVDNEVLETLRILGNSRALIIPFANGELAPAASRETLSLNEKTEARVVEALEKTARTIIASFQKKIDDESKTAFDAINVVKSLMRDGLSSRALRLFQFNGKPVSATWARTLRIPKFGFYDRRYHYSRNGSTFRMKPSSGHVKDIIEYEKMTVVFNDVDLADTTVKLIINRSLNGEPSKEFSEKFAVYYGDASETRKARIKALLGVDVNFVALSDLKDRTKKTRVNGTARNYSESSNETVFAKVVRSNGYVDTADNIKIDPSMMWSIDASLVEDQAFASPSTTGIDGFRYVVRNGNNAAKLERLGVKRYEDNIADSITEDMMKRAAFSRRFWSYRNTSEPLLDHTANRLIEAEASHDNIKELLKHANDYWDMVDSDDVSVPSLTCNICKQKLDDLGMNDLLEEIDNLITELKTDYDTSILGCVNGFGFKEAVKMFEFCRDNGYYDKTDNA